MIDPGNRPDNDSEVDQHEFNPFPDSAAEAAVLGAQLGALARAYANLVAACRAGLLADRDGEPDPWAYIRDELPDPPPGHPLHRDNGGDSEGAWGGW